MQPPGRTRSIAPAAAVVALVFMATAALRGFLPGADPPPREAAPDSPLASVIVVGLLIAAIAVVAVAVAVRLRSGIKPAPHPAVRPDWLRREQGRLTWRVWLGLVAAALLLAGAVMLLGRLGVDGEAPAPGHGQSSAATKPTPDPTPAAAAAPRDPGAQGNFLGYFYAASAAFVFVLVAGSIIANRRQRRPVWQNTAPHVEYGGDTPPDADSESLMRAARVGLAEVGDPSRDPRGAIIACYAAMEQELSLLPAAAPRDFDTASEVLARAVDNHALRPDSATQLVDLFDEARFSPHVMDEGHRDAAVTILTRVLSELRSHAEVIG